MVLMKMEENKPIHKILLPAAVRALRTIAKRGSFQFSRPVCEMILGFREH